MSLFYKRLLMKVYNTLQLRLLKYLNGKNSVCKNKLAALFECSVLELNNEIRELIALGAPIYDALETISLHKAMQALDVESISNQISRNHFKPPQLLVFTEVDSTNNFLKKIPQVSEVQICCAEKQTQGKGRFGRTWESPFGENIYFSLLRPLPKPIKDLPGLSLVIGLAIIASLRPITTSIMLKWPNDLISNNKKLGGILIETKTITEKDTCLIIGIGINVNSDFCKSDSQSQSWRSLFDITGILHNRSELIATLYLYLETYLEKFLMGGLGAFLAEWQRYDFLKGKITTVLTNNQKFVGLVVGINKEGWLHMKDLNGKSHYFSSGDTSINAFVPS